MSQMASAELRKGTTAFHARDVARARELDSDDDPLDHLNREICDTIAHLEGSPEQRTRASPNANRPFARTDR